MRYLFVFQSRLQFQGCVECRMGGGEGRNSLISGGAKDVTTVAGDDLTTQDEEEF